MDPPPEGHEPMPEQVAPMLARAGALPAEGAGWAYEVKWDGVRAVVFCAPGRVRLQGRSLADMTAQYPEVQRLARALGHRRAVLDGELVAFDERGMPSEPDAQALPGRGGGRLLLREERARPPARMGAHGQRLRGRRRPGSTPRHPRPTKRFAKAVAELLEQAEPELVVSRQAREARAGRVLVDWSQNDRHKTTVCAYSPRARERPTVSTPVTWDEVRACLDAEDPGLLTFTTDAVVQRAERDGDLFAEVLSVVQRLPAL